MNCINFTVLLAWLACVLVVMATTASVTAGQPTTAPPQSLSVAMSPAPVIVKGTVTYRERALPIGKGTFIGNQVLTVQLVDITKADAPAVVLGEQIMMMQDHPTMVEVMLVKTGPRSSLDLPLGIERLARFSH